MPTAIPTEIPTEIPTVVSIGATSRIAIEMQRIWARKGHNLALYSRNKRDLEIIAKDLKIHGANNVSIHSLNNGSPQNEPPPDMDILLISIGSLSDQNKWERDNEYRHQEWQTNTTLVTDWIEWGATQIEQNKKGHICVITSVAADRAKKSNYAYGAAKAALDFYCLGVAHRLAAIGNRVSILKPGPTLSPMTKDMANKKLADPKEVAIEFVKDIDKKRLISYSPKVWKYIMLVIKYIPTNIWHKTNF